MKRVVKSERKMTRKLMILFVAAALTTGVTGMWENRSSHNMVAVDRQLKNEWDAPTVGLVLCRDGNRTVIEYALSVTDNPMGVSKYRLPQKAPKELSSMKRAVAKLGTVVDETIADAERQIAEAKKGSGK